MQQLTREIGHGVSKEYMKNNEWKHMQVKMVSELQLECSILITML